MAIKSLTSPTPENCGTCGSTRRVKRHPRRDEGVCWECYTGMPEQESREDVEPTRKTEDTRKKVYIISTKEGIQKVTWDKDSAEVTVSILKSQGKRAWWELHTIVGGDVIIEG